jgi:hypothetical protein
MGYLGYLDIIREVGRAYDPKLREYLLRARQGVLTMLNKGKLPQEGEDYGLWKPEMTQLVQAFEQEGVWGVQKKLAGMLYGQESDVSVLLEDAICPDRRPWKEALEEIWEEIWEEIEAEEAAREADERRAAAERRMRERLARTSGDSMADEIMAMLNEQDLSRTDIYRRYSRNVSAERINDALFVLERLGWARWQMVSSGGGRPREVWSLTPDRV